MLSLLLLLLPHPALAYESDQLTGRANPPADALVPANEELNRLLAQAVATTNQISSCEGTDDEMHVTLARVVFETVSRLTTVPARGHLPPMIYGIYAAWLETADIDRRTFEERVDIYRKVTFWENAILARFGPASTVRFGDVLLGTDKIDHFWEQGYQCFKVSRWGQEPEKAIRWSTRMERTIWGLGSTQVFSFADLAANYDGFTFFNDLLEPQSEILRRPDGCVEQVRPFDWSEWVDWEYDEFLNPNAYEPEVLQAIQENLRSHREEVCADYMAWAQQGIFPRHLRMDLSQPRAYVVGDAPVQVDPFHLEILCEDYLPAD